MNLIPHFTFYCKISKITLDEPELHKVCLTIRTSSQWHDDIHLNIIPTLLEVFLRHLSYSRMEAFNKVYDKTN